LNFQMPVDPNNQGKTLEAYLQYGNLIYIEHIPTQNNDGSYNGKLPAWVGIILRDRTWNSGVLECKAHSAEAIATVRPLQYLDKVQGTPKVIFQQILQSAAVNGGIELQPGIIEDSSKQLSDYFHSSAYEHIVNIVKRARMSWSVTGEIDSNGKLNLYANLFAAPGKVSGLSLNNINSELSSPLLREQGTPYNTVFGYSQADTKQKRYMQKGVNEGALGDYGFMGINRNYMGLTDPASTLTAAQAEADIFGRPVRFMDRNALDFKNTFDFLRTGDSVHVDEHGAGFNPNGGFGVQADATILSMSYNDLSNKVSMHLEVT